jgi:hypothetical protein
MIVNPMSEFSCANCGHHFQGEFCNKCGQKAFVRFTSVYLWRGLRDDLIGVDRGLIFTFTSLCVSPGKTIRKYLQGATVSYFSPLKYLLFGTAIYLLSLAIIGVDEPAAPTWNTQNGLDYIFTSESLAEFQGFLDWFMKYKTSFYFLGIIPFLSLVAFWLFRANSFNYTEIVIFYTYFCAQFVFGAAFLNLLRLIPAWNESDAPTYSIFALYLFLYFRMQSQFFPGGWKSIPRSAGVLAFGTVLFWLLVFIAFHATKIVAALIG